MSNTFETELEKAARDDGFMGSITAFKQGARWAFEKLKADFRKTYPCSCDKAYKSRELIDPNCVSHDVGPEIFELKL